MTALVPTPLEPAPPTLDPADPTTALTAGVSRALEALPGHFRTDIRVSGIPLPDLFSLNTALGATLEREVVRVLNDLRHIWDPNNNWPRHVFVRYGESFPDVRLEDRSGSTLVTALGIELKGWFILAKEKEPSFRYKISPAACSPWDLLCIVPWYLDGAIDGHPAVTSPFVTSARYAAELRNFGYEHTRDGKPNPVVRPTPLPEPYPAPKSKHNDAPTHSDSNFGRIARIAHADGTGFLTEFVTRSLSVELAGVAAMHWLQFLLAVSDRHEDAEIERRLRQMAKNSPQRLTGQRVLEALLDDLK